MSLLSNQPTLNVRSLNDLALLHRLECRACPLDKVKGGKIAATGSLDPLIYILGESPESSDTELQEQFTGEAGELLRKHIPRQFKSCLRWNNVVRSRVPNHAAPEQIMVECFPEGTLVSAVGEIRALYRRYYEGQIFSATFKSGNVLTATPNHPVFTQTGRIALGSVVVGDKLFRAVNTGLCSVRGNPDRDDKPTPINEVFDTFGARFEVCRKTMTPFDFHGDGVADCNVDIIRPFGDLSSGGEAGVNFSEQIKHQAFTRSYFTLRALVNFGSKLTNAFVFSVVGAFNSFFRRSTLHPKAAGGAYASNLDSFVPEIFSESVSVNAFTRCNSFSTFSVSVAGLYVSFKRHFSKAAALQPSGLARSALGSERDVFAMQEFFDCTWISPCQTGEGRNTFSRQVQFDEVVKVESISDFRGHVYNLETASGRYWASGVQVSNCCRPSVVRDIELSKPKAIFGFGGVVLNWASEFSGVMIWRGRKMPVKIGNHVCWYYPMLHPGYLLKQRRGGSPSEEERMFKFDLERAFAEIEGLPEAVVHTSADVRKGVETTSHDVKHVREALEWAAQQPVIGIDLETNGLRPYAGGAKILSAAVGTGDRAFAFALNHPEAEWDPVQRVIVKNLWRKFFINAKGVKVAHSLAFEMEWTGFFYGWDLLRGGKWGDTAVQAVILDERRGKQRPGPLSLEFLVQQYFGFNLKNLAGVDRKNLENTPIEAVLQYNAPDARYAALLYEKQRALIAQEGLEEAYELGLRRVPTCVLTQAKGVPVDQVEVKRLQKKYAAQIQETEQEIALLPVVREFQKKTNAQFNPLSNPDVIKILKDFLHRSEILVVDKFTKKQKYSADEAVLAGIDHPLAELLVKLRKVNKRKSTYVDPLCIGHESSVIYPDGLSHAQFNTIFAETGRLSASEPNWQNVPKRDSDAKELRKQVVAKTRCVILAFDFAQLEARVIALITKDPRFCKALWERYDVHMEWAERLAHAYPSRVGGKKFLTDKKVMKDFRTDVKNQWTFPLFFGAKLESAAGYLKIPTDVIKPLYKEFWKQFSGVKAWQEQLVEFYNEYGYVECLTGRRRRGPLSINQICNSPVQGTAAEIVLLSMSRLSETGDPDLQPNLNIHDDLTWIDVPVKQVDTLAERIIPFMLDIPYDWGKAVPMAVEMSVVKIGWRCLT